MKYYAVNYNTLEVFDTKKQLIDFYRRCAMCSEGHEQHRYMQILMEIYDSNIATDVECDLDRLEWRVREKGGKTYIIDEQDYLTAIKSYENGTLKELKEENNYENI